MYIVIYNNTITELRYKISLDSIGATKYFIEHRRALIWLTVWVAPNEWSTVYVRRNPPRPKNKEDKAILIALYHEHEEGLWHMALNQVSADNEENYEDETSFTTSNTTAMLCTYTIGYEQDHKASRAWSTDKNRVKIS
jgi:hypothetical protein